MATVLPAVQIAAAFAAAQTKAAAIPAIKSPVITAVHPNALKWVDAVNRAVTAQNQTLAMLNEAIAEANRIGSSTA